MKDLRIDTYTTANVSPIISMVITHTPTGYSVKGEGKLQYVLKRDLIKELKYQIERR